MSVFLTQLAVSDQLLSLCHRNSNKVFIPQVQAELIMLKDFGMLFPEPRRKFSEAGQDWLLKSKINSKDHDISKQPFTPRDTYLVCR